MKGGQIESIETKKGSSNDVKPGGSGCGHVRFLLASGSLRRIRFDHQNSQPVVIT